MKRFFKFNLWGILLIVATTVTSCSVEEGPQTIPNMKNIICNAGDRPTFTFTAGDSWQLSSDATWCKFITSAGEQQDMSGYAGTHTITLKITDEGIKNQPTFAHITIKMGESSAIIVTIERGADRLYMRIYDITETPISAVELGYVDWVPFYIEANFRFAAVDFPDWIELGVKDGNDIVAGAITGSPDEITEAYARIINDGERECHTISIEDGYVVTFSDESGENTFEFPIIYNGMGKDDLTFVGPSESTFGWEVSLDGSEFRQIDEETGVVTVFNDGLEYSIASRDNEYTTLFIEKVVDRGIPSYDFDATWMHFDIQEMILRVDPAESTRYGMVMALPNGIYNRIRTDLAGNILEPDESTGVEGLWTVKYEYLQYTLIEFTQCDFAIRGEYDGMYIYHSLTTLEIPAKRVYDNTLMEEYGVEEVYICPFVNSIKDKTPGIIIDPRIENWTTSTFEAGTATATVTYKGESLKISENEYYMGENKDEKMSLHLWGPNEEFNDNVYILFKVGDQAKKLLVVTPPVK